MRVFKNKWFDRFAEKENITANDLKKAVEALEADQADADLGGGVYKVRVARKGESKAGGYRVIVFFRSEERTIFAYGFAKSRRSNIDQGELRGFKKDAKFQLSLTDEQMDDRLRNKKMIEIF